MMKKPDFFHVDTNLWKIELDFKKIGIVLVKDASGHSDLRTLKLALCQGKTNDVNRFLMC